MEIERQCGVMNLKNKKKNILKKLMVMAIALICILSVPFFAYADGNGYLSAFSQGEIAFYIIIAGACFALIGVICLLIAMLKKVKVKDTENLDEYNDYDEYDDYDDGEYLSENDEYSDEEYADEEYTDEEYTDEEYDCEDYLDEVTSDDADNDISEEVAENDDLEDENTEAEPKDEEIFEDEDVAEEEVSSLDTEDEETGKVMITLSGINNSDVKIMEFKDTATIGRRPTNTLMIADNAVSGEHLRFIVGDGEVSVEDMNSTNGTYLNGEKITNAKISSGDELTIGKGCFRVNVSFRD